MIRREGREGKRARDDKEGGEKTGKRARDDKEGGESREEGEG